MIGSKGLKIIGFILILVIIPLKANSFEDGLQLYKQEKMAEANLRFQSYLRVEPNDDLAWLYLGLTYQASELWSESEEAWIAGLELDGEHQAEIAFLLGNLYLYLEKFARAHDAYSLASVQLPAAFLNKANLFLRQEKYSEALQAYKTYIKLRPFDRQREKILKLIDLLEKDAPLDNTSLSIEQNINDAKASVADQFSSIKSNAEKDELEDNLSSKDIPTQTHSLNNDKSESLNFAEQANQSPATASKDENSQTVPSKQSNVSNSQTSESLNSAEQANQSPAAASKDENSQKVPSKQSNVSNSQTSESISPAEQSKQSKNNATSDKMGNNSDQKQAAGSSSSSKNLPNSTSNKQGIKSNSSAQKNNSFNYPNLTAPQKLPEIQQQSDLAEIDE